MLCERVGEPDLQASLSDRDLIELEASVDKRVLRHFIEDAWHVVEPSAPFSSNWHIHCIADHLAAVTSGELRNLIINIPPRHGKSLIVSVFWPTWVWASRPAMCWLFSSYAEGLSIRDSLRCRRLIQSSWYQARWGRVFRLAGDQNLKHRYDNDRGGYRIATGVGGSNTGEGGDILVADDPHNVVDGESDVMRGGVLTWWDEVMSTRLNDPQTGRKVVIMQRVHGDDLTGHLLERGGYHHLCLPARFEPRVVVQGGIPVPQPHDDCPIHGDKRSLGDLLWPSRFGEAALTSLERDLGPYGAAGQLQERPVPREGAVFQDDWFRPLPTHIDLPGPSGGPSLRQTLRKVLFWDLAYSEREMADYTAAVTVGVDTADNHYVLNVWRERVDEKNLSDEIATHILAMRPQVVGIEQGAFKAKVTGDIIRQVHRKLSAAGFAVDVRAVPADRDKVTRAQLPAGRGKMGMVYADRGAPWWDVFQRELLGFPRQAHDDQVDAYAGATHLAIEWHQLTSVQSDEPQRQTYALGAGPQQPAWDPFAGHREIRIRGRSG